MTAMPDLIAKTRIFNAIEILLNDKVASINELEDLQDLLKTKPISAVMQQLIDDGMLPMKQDDCDHICKHIFGTSGPQHSWWEEFAEEVTTEGFAQLIDHMIWNGAGTDFPEKRSTPRKVNCLWLCPASYYYRTIISRSQFADEVLTFILLTPPKMDHPKHYAEYKFRREFTKQKEKHGPYVGETTEENVWVTSLIEDTVDEGTDSSGNTSPIAIPVPPITPSIHVRTVRLLAEKYGL